MLLSLPITLQIVSSRKARRSLKRSLKKAALQVLHSVACVIAKKYPFLGHFYGDFRHFVARCVCLHIESKKKAFLEPNALKAFFRDKGKAPADAEA